MKVFACVLLALLAVSLVVPETSVPGNTETQVSCLGGRVLRILGGSNRRERRQERRANAC